MTLDLSTSITMAPNLDTTTPNAYPKNAFSKPQRLSMEGLQRAVSDLSLELIREEIDTKLAPINEVESAKCECCGMCEECTPEYIRRVQERFCGRWICGLCAEAVKEEVERVGKGGGEEEALGAHMSMCVRFNRIGRTHPVLYQAEAVREILKKSSLVRTKSISPKVRLGARKGGIARSSSCIPAITKETREGGMVAGSGGALLTK